MYRSMISYDPNKAETAGYYKLTEVKLADADKKMLLNYLFWLTYTQEGRGFLLKNRVSQGVAEDTVRTEFLKSFVTYGLIDVSLQNALINGHLAADRWTVANSKMPDAQALQDRETQERIFQQNVAFITWCLWEDAMGQGFSLLW